MNRRNFIGGIAGILAAGAAPAVLSQGSIMRLWVPPVLPRGIWVPIAEYEKLYRATDQTSDLYGSFGITRVDHRIRVVNLHDDWMAIATDSTRRQIKEQA